MKYVFLGRRNKSKDKSTKEYVKAGKNAKSNALTAGDGSKHQQQHEHSEPATKKLEDEFNGPSNLNFPVLMKVSQSKNKFKNGPTKKDNDNDNNNTVIAEGRENVGDGEERPDEQDKVNQINSVVFSSAIV